MMKLEIPENYFFSPPLQYVVSKDVDDEGDQKANEKARNNKQPINKEKEIGKEEEMEMEINR
jgi:hypothetical protein